MQKHVFRIFRLTLGLLFFALGLVGLVVPILQGWLFLALAALVLSRDIPILTRLVDWIGRRFPALQHPIQRWRRFVARFEDG